MNPPSAAYRENPASVHLRRRPPEALYKTSECLRAMSGSSRTEPDASQATRAQLSMYRTYPRTNRLNSPPAGRFEPALADPVDETAGRASSAWSSQAARYHATMTKHLTVRLPDDLAAEAEAVARAEGISLNETIKEAVVEAVDRRRRDPAFKKRLRQIIDQDRELLERLAR